MAERSDLLAQVLHPRPARRALGGVALIQTLEIVVQLRVGLADERGQGRAREVTILVVDRLDPGAIHRDQLPPKQVQLTAQQNELPEYSSKGSAVVTAEVGNGLEVGLEVAKKPDYLDVPRGFRLQPAAGADPIEVAVDVELKQIGRRIARSTCCFGFDPSKARRL